MSLAASVACKSFSAHESDPTQQARLQYVHDKTHVLYFTRDTHSSYYRFVTCFIKATSTDTPQLLERSCVNAFELQDGTKALFTLQALESVEPDGQWQQADIDALNRLKAQHQAIIQSTPPPDPESAPASSHNALHLAGAGYALIGLDLIRDALVNPFLIKMNRHYYTSMKLMRHAGMILVATGIGVYFASPAKGPVKASCAPSSAPKDDDPLAAHFTNACGQAVQSSFKDAADTLAAKYVTVPALQLHWQHLSSTTDWAVTPTVSDLATGLARHINHTLFSNKTIVSICFPALSNASQDTPPKTMQDLINDRKAQTAGKLDLTSVRPQCTELT